MELRAIFKTNKNYKCVQKSIRRYEHEIKRHHNVITTYHFRKFIELHNGFLIDGSNKATFIHNNANYTVYLVGGRIVLDSTVTYYLDSNHGIPLCIA